MKQLSIVSLFILKKASAKRGTALGLCALFIAATLSQSALAVDYNFYSSNNILYYDPTACDPTASNSTGTGVALSGGAFEDEIWNYLTNPGLGKDALKPEQAAGIMGNMSAESSFNPTAVEPAPGTGIGLIQWSFGRADNLRSAASKAGVSWQDLKFQLDYLVNESKSRTVSAVTTSLTGVSPAGSEWATLQTITDVDTAAWYWHSNSEVSNDTKAMIQNDRIAAAETVLAKYKGVTPKNTASSDITQKPVVFLDPGHGAAIPNYTDAGTGLMMNETANTPEREDVLDVANRIKTKLDQDGYNVVLSHTGANDAITFRQRADAARLANAQIGISIHTSPGASNTDDNFAWAQHPGFRENKSGSIKAQFGTTTQEQATIAKSQTYAAAIATARQAADPLNRPVSTDLEKDASGSQTYPEETASFGRGGNILSPGNIPFVALMSSSVPWVYNEIYQDGPNNSITDATKQNYADGIIKGVENSIPLSTTAANQCGGGSNFAGGNFVQTLMAYAWPDYHAPNYLQKEPAYDKAVQTAISAGRYVGGGSNPGIDCGGFVTTLMIDSGYEPGYNYGSKLSAGAGGTVTQQTWLDAHWQNLGPSGTPGTDASRLKQGDVAVNSDHTYVYVGKVTGFNSVIASASFSTHDTSWRAPMAGSETTTMTGFTWYRKK